MINETWNIKKSEEGYIVPSIYFYTKYLILNQKFGILPPDKYDQDWQWTCGKWEQTEDYITFYNDYFLLLNHHQKHDLINMIIQGFDEMFIECLDVDSTYRETVWNKIKTIPPLKISI